MSAPIGVGTEFIYNSRKFKISGRVKNQTETFKVKDLEYEIEELWSLEQILECWQNESLIFKPLIEGGKQPYTDMMHLSEDENNRIQFKLYCIKPLIDISDKELASAVKLQLEELKEKGKSASRSSLYEWRKLYIQSNRDAASLITGYGNTGNQGKKRIEDRVYEIIDETIDRLLMNKSGTKTIEVCKQVRVQIKQENKERLKQGFEPLKIPSDMTIYRRFNEKDEFEKAKKRFSYLYARTKHGYIGITDKLGRPLQVVEIDHSPIDLLLVDDETRTPLPRGNFTAVIDVFSRYILGFNITFENASYKSDMLTLLHAISKKNLKEKFPDILNDHLSYGIPEIVVMDRGKDFKSKWLTTALTQLGCEDPSYNDPKSPWQKPHIERFFSTKNQTFDQRFQGTTFSNNQEARKRDQNPQEKAVIGIQAYISMFNKWLMDDYHIHVMDSLGDSPMNVFRQGIKQNPPRVRNMQEVKMALLPFVSRIIDRGMLKTWKLKYRSHELYDLEKYLESLGGSQKVMAKYDPDDISHLYVWDVRIKQYLKVPCDEQEYTSGLNLHLHLHIRNKKLRDDKLTVQEVRDETSESLWKMAEEEKKKGKKISKLTAQNSGYGSNQDINHIEKQKKKVETRQLGKFDDDEEFYELGGGYLA